MASRALLLDAGIDRWAVAAEVRAGRWVLHGRHTVAAHTANLSREAQLWRAVWEVGRSAALDGVSSLEAAGLTGFDEATIHVSIDHQGHGGRRVALVLCLAVQQRLVRAQDLVPLRWPGAHYGRSAFVRQVIDDVTDGAHSLGELDFATLCRSHHLPAPDRQVVRTGVAGRIYLDVRWQDCPLAVEIDGAQHRLGLAVSADNLRRNALALEGETVLTIDLVGLRLQTEAFMRQVVTAYRSLTGGLGATG